jgi:hypothetical protein
MIPASSVRGLLTLALSLPCAQAESLKALHNDQSRDIDI